MYLNLLTTIIVFALQTAINFFLTPYIFRSKVYKITPKNHLFTCITKSPDKYNPDKSRYK